jgi:succinoglycan biosynthesis transport protein ExoP
LAIILCSFALAVLYLVFAPPRFTASAAVVIDTRKIQVLEKEFVLGEAHIDASLVHTHVGLLKSDNVALGVIRKLHLIDDPEFVPPAGGKSIAPISFLFSKEPTKVLNDEERERIALGSFR